MAGRVTGLLKALGVHYGQDAQTQILALDDEFHSMELEITNLKAQKLHLEAQVNPLERQVERYKKQLEVKGGLSLTQDEEKVFKFIVHKQVVSFSAEIAEGTRLNKVRTEHFLKQLIDRGLVRLIPHYAGGVMYGLTADGNAYAVEQGWA
jgi:hypothetical protein